MTFLFAGFKFLSPQLSARVILIDEIQSLTNTNSPRIFRTVKNYSTKHSGRWPHSKGNRTEQLEPPFRDVQIETGSHTRTSFWKPTLFTVIFSSASIAGAAVWQYENVRTRTSARLHNTLQWLHEKTKKRAGWRNDLRTWWNNLSESDRVFIPICLVNIAVFAAWRLPALQTTMVKYFCSTPASKTVCWPMLFSVFSHYSALHIFANMYVLHSFSRGAVRNLGYEQFVGFYLAAGVIASFCSYAYKTAIKKPGLSLGASGAIMGILGYTCSQYPDLDLRIIFLPFFTFKAAAALKVIMGIDAVGVLLGWKFFDHAAHLGGALFGIFWALWGQQHIWRNKKSVVDAWINIRGPP